MTKEKVPTEHIEQVAVINWLRANHPDVLFYAVPNGGFRHQRTAALLAAEGVVAGVPDLVIAEPSGQHHGLYVEMKRVKGSRTSPEQNAFCAKLIERGYAAHVCKGSVAAIAVIESYLDGTGR